MAACAASKSGNASRAGMPVGSKPDIATSAALT
jgi:hypothetical protein